MRLAIVDLSALLLAGILVACSTGTSPADGPEAPLEKPRPPEGAPVPGPPPVVLSKQEPVEAQEGVGTLGQVEISGRTPNANLSVESSSERPAAQATRLLEAQMTFEELQSRSNKPAYMLMELRGSADAVVIGAASRSEEFEAEDFGPKMNRTVIEVAETIRGEMPSRFEVVWPVTSESAHLKVGMTYLLFLRTSEDGEIWFAAGRRSALRVEGHELHLEGRRSLDEAIEILKAEEGGR